MSLFSLCFPTVHWYGLRPNWLYNFWSDLERILASSGLATPLALANVVWAQIPEHTRHWANIRWTLAWAEAATLTQSMVSVRVKRRSKRTVKSWSHLGWKIDTIYVYSYFEWRRSLQQPLDTNSFIFGIRDLLTSTQWHHAEEIGKCLVFWCRFIFVWSNVWAFVRSSSYTE